MRRVAVVVSVAALLVLPGNTFAQATFPGANGLIAFYDFAAYANGTFAQIYTIAPDGTGKVAITATLHSNNVDPSWSADGTKIAYVNLGKTNSLRIMNADGSGVTTVLSGSAQFSTPSWSPDGSQIAFCRFKPRKGTESVLVVGSDGNGLVDISGSHQECDPAWSPDGTTIAVDTVSGRIEAVSPDGGTRTPMVRNGYNSFPSWSPDGASLVFQREIGMRRNDIWSINANGTGLTQLTATPKRWEFTPTYSPDGTEILFSRTIGKSVFDTDDLWIANTDGSGPARITDTPRVDEFNADWQAA